MTDETVMRHAEAMADALGDESWRSWTQEQANEVGETLDNLHAALRRLVEINRELRVVLAIAVRQLGGTLTITRADVLALAPREAADLVIREEPDGVRSCFSVSFEPQVPGG